MIIEIRIGVAGDLSIRIDLEPIAASALVKLVVIRQAKTGTYRARSRLRPKSQFFNAMRWHELNSCVLCRSGDLQEGTPDVQVAEPVYDKYGLLYVDVLIDTRICCRVPRRYIALSRVALDGWPQIAGSPPFGIRGASRAARPAVEPVGRVGAARCAAVPGRSACRTTTSQS